MASIRTARRRVVAHGFWGRNVLAAALAATMLWGCDATGKSDQPPHARPPQSAPVPVRPTEPALSAAQRQLNAESFDVVWKTVRDLHWDPELGGLDWQAVADELRPQVEQAATMSAARALMRSAIEHLGQSHFGIIADEVYEQLDAPPESGDGETGLTLRVLNGDVLVTAVAAGSPATEQGVRPGYELTEVNSKPVAPMLAKISQAYDESTLKQLMFERALQGRLGGPVGKTVALEFLGADGQPVSIDLKRAAPQGRRVSFGYLPTMYLRFEQRRLDGNVGYIAFNIFLDPQNLMKEFEDAVHAFASADGVIIDLRGNPGGIGGLAMGMAGWFIDHTDDPLGTMRTRQTALKFAVFSRAETYDGPLAVLVDGCSGSTAEILAGGLQDLGRARVFGTRSAGAALPSVIVKLPNGDGFQYAIADYVTTSGRRLEGAGVLPDVAVVPTREQLLAGRDPVIDAAVEWIRTQAPVATPP